MPSSLPTKTKPASPAKKQAGPVKKQAGPAKKPAGPAKKQAGPLKKPAGSVKKPAGPVKKPAGPVRKQAGPAKKQAGPVKKQAGPAKKQASPAKKPVGPAKKPAGPVKKPAGPVRKPAGPLKEPAGPVKKPARTVKKQAGSEKKPPSYVHKLFRSSFKNMTAETIPGKVTSNGKTTILNFSPNEIINLNAKYTWNRSEPNVIRNKNGHTIQLLNGSDYELLKKHLKEHSETENQHDSMNEQGSVNNKVLVKFFEQNGTDEVKYLDPQYILDEFTWDPENPMKLRNKTDTSTTINVLNHNDFIKLKTLERTQGMSSRYGEPIRHKQAHSLLYS